MNKPVMEISEEFKLKPLHYGNLNKIINYCLIRFFNDEIKKFYIPKGSIIRKEFVQSSLDRWDIPVCMYGKAVEISIKFLAPEDIEKIINIILFTHKYVLVGDVKGMIYDNKPPIEL